MTNRILAVSASMLALGMAQAAHAQQSSGEATAAGPSGIADIVVTATRQATNLQDTPLAITAVTADDLEARGLANAADLARIIPNANFRRTQGAFGPGMSALIRGIGQTDTGLASEPGVAFYIDDVYYPLVFGSMFDLLELDRVEVLRGPQGTLFGRNALAGAVNLVTRKPSLSEASAYVEATIGEYSRRDFRAGFNVPLSDTMALSVSGLSKKRLGYQKRLDFRCEMIRRGTPELAGDFPFSSPNLVNESNFGVPDDCTIGYLGGEEAQAGRAQLLWEPRSNFSLVVSADYLRDDSDSTADSVIAINPAIAAGRQNIVTLFDRFTHPGGPTFAYDERFLTGDPFTTYATFADPVPAGTAIPGNTFYNGSPFRGGIVNPSTTPLRSWGISTRAVYGITPEIDITLAMGYRDFSATYGYDVDGSPVALENNRNDVKQDHFSAELRGAGSHEWIDWVAGLFYYEANGNQRFAGTSPYNNTLRYQNNNYSPVSKAAFANVTLRPFDGLGIVLGGRYSDETKPVDFYAALDGTTADSTEFTIAPTGSTIFPLDIKDSRADWKIGLNYELDSDTLVYASAATGARLPGFNARPLQTTQIAQFPGDEIITYELGAKTDFFNRRVRLNATAFYTDYKTRTLGVSGQEYQIDEATGIPRPGNQLEIPSTAGEGVTTCRNRTPEEIASGVEGFTCVGRTFYRNSAGEVWGLEAELQAEPVDYLLFNGSFGYNKFTSPDISARPETANRRSAGPDFTASAGVQYEFDTRSLGGSITPRLDWFYTASQRFSATNKAFNYPGYSLFNTRVTYRNDDHDFSISVGVTNLFDKFYWRNFFIYQEIGFPQNNGQPGAPREWFLSMEKRL